MAAVCRFTTEVCDAQWVIGDNNAGGARPKPRDEYKDDPHFPKTTEQPRKLELSKDEHSLLYYCLRPG